MGSDTGRSVLTRETSLWLDVCVQSDGDRLSVDHCGCNLVSASGGDNESLPTRARSWFDHWNTDDQFVFFDCDLHNYSPVGSVEPCEVAGDRGLGESPHA